jgi:3-hydroxyisobutyrate dehydrogenase
MNISPETTRIGWIGTGVMCTSMCGHLMAAGYQCTVFNRTKSKADGLVSRGAIWANSPRDVAEASDVVFTIVGMPADVRHVLLNHEHGALAGCKEGAVLVDMTTSEPSLAVEIAKRAAEHGVTSIDAPVSGGDVGAKNAALSIMIGGDAEVVAALEPLWSLMGNTYVHQGPAGAGQHTKMVNQTLVAGGMISVCEALLYAYTSGLDLETALKSVSSGAAGSWALSNLGPRIIAGNFEPGFYVEHFLKDLRIVLDESRRMGIALPGVALVEQLYRATAAQGHAKNGTQALMLALAEISGIDWQNRPAVEG